MAYGRRSGCVTALVVVLVLAVVAAAVGWVMWTRYTATPQYATLKALQAVSWRDYDGFTRWVDVDAVVSDAVSKTPAGSRLPEALTGAVEDSAKAAIRQRVTQGMPGVPRNVPFVVLMSGNVIRSASISGEDAFVTARTTSGGRDMRLDLRLRRQEGRWRVVEVRNVSELLLRGL